MAAVALVNIGAFDLTAGELFGALDDGCQGMAVVGVSRERLGMQHELAAGRAGIGADDGCLNAELVGRTPADSRKSSKRNCKLRALRSRKLAISKTPAIQNPTLGQGLTS